MTSTLFAKRPGGPDIRYLAEGSGPAVTLVHGVGASLDSWNEVAARMAPHYRVVRMDLAGHGASGPIRGSRELADFAGDVRLVWDQLGIERTHLAGFSLGGLIAQSLALSDEQRIQRLIILSAVAGRTEEERAKVVGRLALLREGGIAAVTKAAEERWFTAEFRSRNPERVAQRMRELLANDPQSYASAYTVFATSDLGDRIGAISHPTLISTGEHDVGSNVRMARMMHAAIAGSQLRVLPGLRHSVLVEAPQLIADMFIDFLRQDSEQTG